MGGMRGRRRRVARIASRREPTCLGPKVPPTKNGKLLGLGSLFLGWAHAPSNFLIFTTLFYFIFPLRGARPPCSPPPWLRPWGVEGARVVRWEVMDSELSKAAFCVHCVEGRALTVQ